MKIIRSKLFYFLLGVIISGSCVYAVTQINASQVTYTDSNNNETTVDAALNNLYTIQNTTVTNLQTENFELRNRTTTTNLCNEAYTNTKSTAILNDGNLYTNYSHMKITRGWGNSTDYEIKLTSPSGEDVVINQEYSPSKLYLIANNGWACIAITFYN